MNLDQITLVAMKHPQGLQILEQINQLLKQSSFSSAESTETVPASLIDQFPRSQELETFGVNLKNSELLKISKQFHERLPSAINAWIRWAKHTDVQYPTHSLIKAIVEDWQE